MYTLENWNQLLPTRPTPDIVKEYVWTGAANDDLPLVQSVLLYAKHNNYIIDLTHAVHLSCVYNRMEMLNILEQYHPLTPHYVMTGLYSASSGSQSNVLKHLLNKAKAWGHDFYQHVNVNELMDVVCVPGNVGEHQVLECIKIFEPFFDNPEYSKNAISLATFNYPIAAGYLLKYSRQDVLEQFIKDVEQSSPHQAQHIKDVLLREKLAQAVGETPSVRSHKKI
jgi:hypothetical protein